MLDLVGGLSGEGIHVQEDPLPGHISLVVDREGDRGDEAAVRIQPLDQGVGLGFHFRLVVAVDGDIQRGYEEAGVPGIYHGIIAASGDAGWGKGIHVGVAQPHVEHGGDADDDDAGAEQEADHGELHGGASHPVPEAARFFRLGLFYVSDPLLPGQAAEVEAVADQAQEGREQGYGSRSDDGHHDDGAQARLLCILQGIMKMPKSATTTMRPA